jgi:hypothetical protein
MVVWGKSEAEVFCPFCSSGLPTYLNKVLPERMVMSDNRTQNHEAIANDATPQSSSPFIHEFFLVQGNYFRCMAYRNDDGKWRGAFNNEVLSGPVRVLA